jgi:hypothetical protein
MKLRPKYRRGAQLVPNNINPAESDAESLTPVARQVRELLLTGTCPLARCSLYDFASGLSKSPRTIFSWIAQGMPVDYIGRQPWPRPVAALDWLVKRHSSALPPPRRPGRPTKSA